MSDTGKIMLTTQQVADKVEWEGLDYAVMSYFGRDLNSVNEELNDLWAEAYDVLTELRSILFEDE